MWFVVQLCAWPDDAKENVLRCRLRVLIYRIILYVWGQFSPRRGEVALHGKKFFTVDIFRTNASKYTKLKVEPYISDTLNLIYRFFSFLRKKIWNLLNCLEGVKWASFVHVSLYFNGIEIVCSFLKLNCYNLYMLCVYPKGEGLTKHIFCNYLSIHLLLF